MRPLPALPDARDAAHSAPAATLTYARALAAAAALAVALPFDAAAADDDPLLRFASEQGWRAMIDALDRVEPTGDPAVRAARARARLRADAIDPARSSQDRAASWRALDEAHRANADAASGHAARARAAMERACDALRIGLFADASAAAACAARSPEDVARTVQMLQSIEQMTEPFATGARNPPAGAGGSGAAGAAATALPSSDARTIDFLRAAARALRMAIDRTGSGGAQARDRRVAAEEVLAQVRASRRGIPQSLEATADLAECAAASAAGDPDSARAAAVRIVYLGEPLPAMFARILVCDALAEGRLGDRALAELVEVVRVDGLSLPLRLMAADAYVRLRGALGKSSLATPTFGAYAEVIRRAPAQERWAARRAVVERLAPIMAAAVDTSWCPPEGLVARAFAQHLAGQAAGSRALREAMESPNPDDGAFATAAALSAAERSGDLALASDALACAARRFGDDPEWTHAALDAALIEVALDASAPATRPGPLSSALGAAMAAPRPARDDQAAHRTRDTLEAAALAIDALSAASSEGMSAATAARRLKELRDAAARADPSRVRATRVTAALLVLGAMAGDPMQPAAADAPRVHARDAELLGRWMAGAVLSAPDPAQAAAAAERVRTLAADPRLAGDAAAGIRDVARRWIERSAGASVKDACTRVLAVLDAAAAASPPTIDDLRLAVAVARSEGRATRISAADATARARAVVSHPAHTHDDLLALADALIAECTLAPASDSAPIAAEAATVARLAEQRRARDLREGATGAGTVDWEAHERLVRAAEAAGLGDRARAHVQRLAAIDSSFGGVPGRFGDAVSPQPAPQGTAP